MFVVCSLNSCEQNIDGLRLIAQVNGVEECTFCRDTQELSVMKLKINELVRARSGENFEFPQSESPTCCLSC